MSCRGSRILGMPVYGARKRLSSAHYDEHGFDDTFAHLLVEASRLPRVVVC